MQLNTGVTIPSVGLGTFTPVPKGTVGRAVDAAVRAGYRHIDTAWHCGNEEEIGSALRALFDEGVVKREEMFITTKLWITRLSPADVEPSFRDSLKKLKIDYIDLYLIHAPTALKRDANSFPPKPEDIIGYDPECISNTWEAMEQLVEEGLVKAIGISNFSITKTENLLKTAKIVPAVNQVECQPYFQQPKLRQYCKQKGIIVVAYAVLGSPWNKTYQKDNFAVMEDPIIKEIAKQHAATPGQICIAFLLSLGTVTIPKSTNEDRIKENLAASKIKLTPEEMERLRNIDKNERLYTFKPFMREEDSVETFWDTIEDESFVL